MSDICFPYLFLSIISLTLFYLLFYAINYKVFPFYVNFSLLSVFYLLETFPMILDKYKLAFSGVDPIVDFDQSVRR